MCRVNAGLSTRDSWRLVRFELLTLSEADNLQVIDITCVKWDDEFREANNFQRSINCLLHCLLTKGIAKEAEANNVYVRIAISAYKHNASMFHRALSTHVRHNSTLRA
jgi:hypothetical protein